MLHAVCMVDHAVYMVEYIQCCVYGRFHPILCVVDHVQCCVYGRFNKLIGKKLFEIMTVQKWNNNKIIKIIINNSCSYYYYYYFGQHICCMQHNESNRSIATKTTGRGGVRWACVASSCAGKCVLVAIGGGNGASLRAVTTCEEQGHALWRAGDAGRPADPRGGARDVGPRLRRWHHGNRFAKVRAGVRILWAGRGHDGVAVRCA